MLSAYINEIASATQGLLDQYAWTEERDVLLGDYVGTTIAANALYPRSVNWHSTAGQAREQGTAVLSSDCNIRYEENDSYASNPPTVTIGKPPRSSILTVKGMASSLAALQAQGNVSQGEQYLQRLGNPQIYNIVDGRVGPTTVASTFVSIESGYYERLSSPGVKRLFSATTLSLAYAISGLASGQHQLALVYLDRERAVPGALLTTPVAAVATLPARTELSDLTSLRLSSTQKALGVVYLYKDQASIVQGDIMSTLDPRFSEVQAKPVCWNNSVVVWNNEVVYN